MSLNLKMSVNRESTEHQQSINDFGYGILYNPTTVLRHLPIIEVLATFMGNMVSVDVATPQNERQQSVNDSGCCILYNTRLVQWHSPIIRVLATFMETMVSVDVTKPKNECQQSVNIASTMLDGASSIIQRVCYGIYP